MKIGFSFGKCVNDIVHGRVAIEDVLFIVSATKLTEIDHVGPVMQSYAGQGYIDCDVDEATRVGEILLYNGRLHQSRMVNAPAVRTDHRWFDLTPSHNSEPSIDTAWNDYQMVVKLVTGATADVSSFYGVLRNPREPKDQVDLTIFGF